MKTLLFFLFILIHIFSQKSSIEIVVDKQIDAYNNRDINAFAKTYHDSVEIYNFPNKLLYKGKEQLIKNYGNMFKKMKRLHAKSIKRIVNKNKLIDFEEASLYSTNTETPDKVLIVLVTYEVINDLITKVQFTW